MAKYPKILFHGCYMLKKNKSRIRDINPNRIRISLCCTAKRNPNDDL